MGNSIRKMFHDESEPSYTDKLPGIGSIFEDPRSPSDSIHRTPIVAATKKPYLETDVDALTPPCHPRIRRLQKEIDPRSPSSQIDRTPISVLDSYERGTVFESPVSLYSRYEGDLSTFPLSPTEPSVNVSDFESELDEMRKQLDHDQFFSDISEKSLVQIIPESSPNDFGKLNVSEEEKLWKKQMCEDLLNEIFESFKECQDFPEQKPASNGTTKMNSPPETNTKPLTRRAPLTNITSAGNTPTKLAVRKFDRNMKVPPTGENTPTKLKFRKDDKHVKVAQTGENSPRSSFKQNYRSQWDHNGTIII